MLIEKENIFRRRKQGGISQEVEVSKLPVKGANKLISNIRRKFGNFFNRSRKGQHRKDTIL